MNTSTNRNIYQNRNSQFKQYLSFDKKYGYLHEIREIPTTTSKTYTARIAVPVGQGEHVKYVNFELYIKSAEALIAFIENQQAINDPKRKVTVRFSCYNTHPKAYIAQNGKNAGGAVPYMAGNLSFLHTMKVDGETIVGFRSDAENLNERVDPDTGEVLSHSNDDMNSTSEVIALHVEKNTSKKPPEEVPPVDAYEDELKREDPQKQKTQVINESEKGEAGKAQASPNVSQSEQKVNSTSDNEKGGTTQKSANKKSSTRGKSASPKAR